MLRRSVISMVGGVTLGAPLLVLAQTAGKVWRIGVLSLSVPVGPTMPPLFVDALAPLGYWVGRNLHIDYEYAQGKPELLSKLAAKLVETKPDLLIGLLISDGLALKRFTTTIPVVMMYATMPVELGLIKSLASPGGNITGTTSVSPDLWAKTFQILRELVPQTSHVAMIFDPDFPGIGNYLRQNNVVAKSLRIRLSNFPVRTVADLDSALAKLLIDRPNAVNVGMAGMLIEHVGGIIEFAARHKLPAHYSIDQPVLRGGLLSYSADFFAMAKRDAWMIDKIFKGAQPGDILMEEPARFRLVINLKTAKAMGLVIPQIVLLQATDFIE